MTKQRRTATRAHIDELATAIRELASDVDDGFHQVNRRLDHHDDRLEKLEAGISRIENKLDPTIERLDIVEGRIKHLERPAA